MFHQSFLRACTDRRFFVTRKGYFGTGPHELKDGDEIYIVAGGNLPLVLRPVLNSKPNTFELIGDCYVHGIMYGEAVSDTPPEREREGGSEENKNRESRDPDLPLRDFHDVFIV
jgi:hypothetical protein